LGALRDLVIKTGRGNSRPNFKGQKMNVILEHPVHGRKIAISEMEIQHDKEHGWVRAKDKPVDNETTNELEVRRRRKPDEA